MAERAWNPWRALRARPEVTFARQPLPASLRGGAVCACWPDGDAVIVIDPRLGRRKRNEALAHELVHLERGGGATAAGMPAGWAAVVVRDEAAVEAEVARRLVPLGRLQLFVQGRVADDQTVTALDVADEFDVTEELAALALTLLPCGSTG